MSVVVVSKTYFNFKKTSTTSPHGIYILFWDSYDHTHINCLAFGIQMKYGSSVRSNVKPIILFWWVSGFASQYLDLSCFFGLFHVHKIYTKLDIFNIYFKYIYIYIYIYNESLDSRGQWILRSRNARLLNGVHDIRSSIWVSKTL